MLAGPVHLSRRSEFNLRRALCTLIELTFLLSLVGLAFL